MQSIITETLIAWGHKITAIFSRFIRAPRSITIISYYSRARAICGKQIFVQDISFEM